MPVSFEIYFSNSNISHSDNIQVFSKNNLNSAIESYKSIEDQLDAKMANAVLLVKKTMDLSTGIFDIEVLHWKKRHLPKKLEINKRPEPYGPKTFSIPGAMQQANTSSFVFNEIVQAY